MSRIARRIAVTALVALAGLPVASASADNLNPLRQMTVQNRLAASVGNSTVNWQRSIWRGVYGVSVARRLRRQHDRLAVHGPGVRQHDVHGHRPPRRLQLDRGRARRCGGHGDAGHHVGERHVPTAVPRRLQQHLDQLQRRQVHRREPEPDHADHHVHGVSALRRTRTLSSSRRSRISRSLCTCIGASRSSPPRSSRRRSPPLRPPRRPPAACRCRRRSRATSARAACSS